MDFSVDNFINPFLITFGMADKQNYIGKEIELGRFNKYGFINPHVGLMVNFDSFIDNRSNDSIPILYDIFIYKDFLLNPKIWYNTEKKENEKLSLEKALENGKDLAKKQSIALLLQEDYRKEYIRKIIWHPENWKIEYK
jgi:hypothetical protein